MHVARSCCASQGAPPALCGDHGNSPLSGPREGGREEGEREREGGRKEREGEGLN